MKIHEFQAKQLLRDARVAVPECIVARTPEEAADAFQQLGGNLLGDKYNDVLFENPGFSNHWISVQLVGTRSNRSAI